MPQPEHFRDSKSCDTCDYSDQDYWCHKHDFHIDETPDLRVCNDHECT